jgi:hypothetical protein
LYIRGSARHLLHNRVDLLLRQLQQRHHVGRDRDAGAQQFRRLAINQRQQRSFMRANLTDQRWFQNRPVADEN